MHALIQKQKDPIALALHFLVITSFYLFGNFICLPTKRRKYEREINGATATTDPHRSAAGAQLPECRELSSRLPAPRQPCLRVKNI